MVMIDGFLEDQMGTIDEMLDTASAETGYRISPAARIWEEEK